MVWGVERHRGDFVGLSCCCCCFCVGDRCAEVCREGEGVFIAEGDECREQEQRGLRDVLFSQGVLAPGVEDADGRRPSEHCAVEGGHGVVESCFPVEGLVVRVDHGKISVEGVEGVADESACFGADDLAA